jgi:UMF1 family MFS transporter
MNRKTVWSWALYDFGNSAFAALFVTIYAVFYAETVVGEPSGSEWWTSVISASMLLVAVTAPLLGGVADHAGVRKRMFALYTGLGIVTVLGFSQIGPGMVVAGFALGVVANFAFEGGIVFYNSFLPEIAPPSHQGRVSALGFAVGYVGSLIALGLAIVFLENDRIELVWVALAAQWAIFSVPALRNLPADRPTGLGIRKAASAGVRQTIDTWKSVLRMPNLRRFLLAYFFYMDGVNTVITVASVYAAVQLDFAGTELIGLFVVVQISALAGSIAMGKPTDRLGPRWAVRVTLLWWIVVVTAAFFAYDKTTFWVVATLAGLGLGSVQASSRAFMSRLVPKGREAELFGFYALCGKTGAILGPFLFGRISGIFDGNQRPAVLSVAAFYVVGFVLLQRVRLPEIQSTSSVSQ